MILQNEWEQINAQYEMNVIQRLIQFVSMIILLTWRVKSYLLDYHL